MLRKTAWLALSFLTSQVGAQTEVERQLKNARLTLGAFECAAVAAANVEKERLFLVGLEAGREFVDFAREDPARYPAELIPKVPLLWSLTSGPTADFILGQIYANRVDAVYKAYTPDSELWQMRKGDMYVDKNCELLGR